MRPNPTGPVVFTVKCGTWLHRSSCACLKEAMLLWQTMMNGPQPQIMCLDWAAALALFL